MFTVNCPGCSATYQVEERRVPPSGLRMRCPKCGNSFMVEAPGAPELEVPPVRAAKNPPERPARPSPPRPGGGAAHKETIVGVNNPLSAPPVELDLPAARGRSDASEIRQAGDVALPELASGDLPAPRRTAFDSLDLEVGDGEALSLVDDGSALPSVVEGRGPRGEAGALESDLPAALGGKGGQRVQPSSARTEDTLPLDLPSLQDNFPAIRSEPPEQPSRSAPAAARGAVPSAFPSFRPESRPVSRAPERADDDWSGVRPSDPPPERLEIDVREHSLPPPVQSARPVAGEEGVGGEFELPSLSEALLEQPASDASGPFSSRKATLGELRLPEIGSLLPPGSAPFSGRGGPASRRQSAAMPIPVPDSGQIPGSPPSLPPQQPPPVSAPSGGDEYGEIDIPGASAHPESLPRSAGGRQAGSPAEVVRQSGGGTSFGEVNLESESDHVLPADLAPRGSAGEALEFGGIPQEPGAAAAPGPAAVRTPAEREVAPPRGAAAAVTALAAGEPSAPSVERGRAPFRSSTMVKVALVAVLGAAAGGGALSLVPDVGPFGVHFIGDQISKGAREKLLTELEARSEAKLRSDDFAGVLELMGELDRARLEHQRFHALSSMVAYLGYAIELRHKNQPQLSARSKVILDEQVGREELPWTALAMAARAAVEGNLARAQKLLESRPGAPRLRRESLVLRAQVALKEQRYEVAEAALKAVEAEEHSARSAFGLARVELGKKNPERAREYVRLTLERNPRHVGARLVNARLSHELGHDSAAAERWLSEVAGLEREASPSDLVEAKTLEGDLELARTRISLAETAYQAALARDPRAAGALRGLGEALYRSGRYAEALARFEAGLQADADDVAVAVGVAKTQISLERIRDAAAVLSKLRQSHPKHLEVNYWFARAQEALGNRDGAEEAYTAAIAGEGTDESVVEAYVGLAMLKNQQGRQKEAQKVLDAALARLPRSPKIHSALGQVALTEGRYEVAVERFRAALALDPADLTGKFRLGMALRKQRSFEESAKAFDEVASVDKDFPGLALERGLLYEAAGQTEQALKAFESALAKAPEDIDLMLRVGCGKVSAGRPAEAESLLNRVLTQRPASAETHHCLGRAQLASGSNLSLALRTLEHAVELDPHRAEYHLYVGWAANEAGRVAVAEQALKRALELDQGLGDAYWQRGVLRYRQGAIRDAVVDLTRSLELRPGRHEAHASLAEAYFDLGEEQKALVEWKRAVTSTPENATWHYRYGKLLQAQRRDAEARAELERALELVRAVSDPPRWVWEAHHLLARALGPQSAAIKHWEEFLRLAPQDNAYRAEAERTLGKLRQRFANGADPSR